MEHVLIVKYEELKSQLREALGYFSKVDTQGMDYAILERLWLAYVCKGDNASSAYEEIKKAFIIRLGRQVTDGLILYTTVFATESYRAKQGLTGVWRNGKRPNEYQTA
jgi:hypothetical protein